MSVDDPLSVSERLNLALDKRARRELWRWVLPPGWEQVASSFSELEEVTDPWIERVVSALKRKRIGNFERAARVVAAISKNEHIWLEKAGLIEAVVELAGASEWASRQLVVRPHLLDSLGTDPHLIRGQAPKSRSSQYATLIDEMLSNLELSDDFDACLRQFRTEQALCIALRELRDADIRATATELSDLADSCVQASARFHYAQLIAQYGPLVPSCRYLIIGLGKLGGRELNFSSDIDVIYLYEHDDGGTSELLNHEFHVRFFGRVTRSLSRVTADGRVFRVDTDLRPEGQTGPLCNSLTSLERYYETWGRTWERAAWIKARPIAGHLDLFADVCSFVQSFVYRGIRDQSVVEEVVRLKGQIDARRRRTQKRRLGSGLDLKLGRGGIREIEFIAQALQLYFGGRDSRLRNPNTLKALRALEAAGWVSAQDREVLSDAYLFLRRLEHRLQLVEDRQTHMWSGHTLTAASVARTLGYSTPDELETELKNHLHLVHERFLNLVGAEGDEPMKQSEVDALIDIYAPREVLEIQLRALGSRMASSTAHSLISIVRIPGSPFHPTASPGMKKLGSQLIAECLASPDLDRALRHLPELLRTLVHHRSYFEQLEKSNLRRGVARALGTSDLLARILSSIPDLLPNVMLLGTLPPIETLKEHLIRSVYLSDIEGSLVGLRLAKQQTIMQIAIAELAGGLPFEESQARMTLLAEACVEACLTLALTEASQKYGPPEDDEAEVAILGGGAFGASELGHRSDLDLLAIFKGEGRTQGGNRGAIAVSEYFTRVVQKMLSYLSLQTAQGLLYVVDMRLRPSGSQGTLVTSIDNFRAYHARGSALWERQALVRTRVVVGSTKIRSEVEAAIDQAAYGVGAAFEQTAKIDAMRTRLVRERGAYRTHRKESFNIKIGEGGLMDIEFIVQHLLLYHAHAYPGLGSANTRKALIRLADAGLLSSTTASRLSTIHDRLRRLLSWLRLMHDETLEELELDMSSLRALARALGYQGRDAPERLRDQLKADRDFVKRTYRKIMISR